ncbi:MAG: hypothetical protein L0H63_00245 [Nitrococcus sp.]|nr:hypothetical protein [Nitrococcus sp.]MDN5869976.1 hypothetical protein [Nitrococcus sp.]
MAEPMTAEDILPLVAGLAPKERVRLLRLMTKEPNANDAAIYSAVPPGKDEFSNEDEGLVWDTEDWGDVD